MSTLDLVFDRKFYPVPKKSVCEFLERRALFQATAYAVQSPVPIEVFEMFINSLTTQAKMSVTTENAVSVSLLAKEFFLSEFATFSVLIDLFSSLSERVSHLEDRNSDISTPPSKFEEAIESHEQGLEEVRLEIDRLKETLGGLQASEPLPAPDVTATPETSPGKVEIPRKGEQSLAGIISYLTTKHGGHVHEKGIVTITSKSVDDRVSKYALKYVADFTSEHAFGSKNEPGQWICWDFREMRVSLTHYTLWTWYQKSWVVEGSLDGKSWTEIDRRTDNQVFKADWTTASFAVSCSAECRFVRLTQTDARRNGDDYLDLRAVEFFGTLYE
jgi:hypothetical protein